MFTGYDFSFAGRSAASLGLYVMDIGTEKNGDRAFGPQGEIIETRTASRLRPVHYGVRYNSVPISFSIVFGRDTPLDPWDLEAVGNWLLGYRNYQWLKTSDPGLEGFSFRCVCTELTPVSHGGEPYAFKADFTCDGPYAYGDENVRKFYLSGEKTVKAVNDGTPHETLPLFIRAAISEGCTYFSVDNLSSGDEAMVFENMPSTGLTMNISSEDGIITEELSGYNMYEYFNFKFPRLYPGENRLKFTGTGTVTIKFRPLYVI